MLQQERDFSAANSQRTETMSLEACRVRYQHFHSLGRVLFMGNYFHNMWKDILLVSFYFSQSFQSVLGSIYEVEIFLHSLAQEVESPEHAQLPSIFLISISWYMSPPRIPSKQGNSGSWCPHFVKLPGLKNTDLHHWSLRRRFFMQLKLVKSLLPLFEMSFSYNL